MSSCISIALSSLAKSVENGKELLALREVSCFSKVSLLSDLMSLLPSVAWGVPVSVPRLMREILERTVFTLPPTPKPQNRGGILVWKEEDELDTGGVVNHENCADTRGSGLGVIQIIKSKGKIHSSVVEFNLWTSHDHLIILLLIQTSIPNADMQVLLMHVTKRE